MPPPEELVATGFLKLVGGVTHTPSDSTCGAKTYDYFIVSRCLAPAVYAVHAIAGADFAPHVPVRLLLRAAPRCMQVRCLAKPRGFGAHLPYGPVSREALSETAQAADIANASSTTSLCVNTEFPKLLALVERQLSGICSHDAYTARAHSGRAAGPKLTWKPALRLGDGLARTSAATRAWARTAGWLCSLAELRPAAPGASRLRRAVCCHAHQGDPGETQLSLFLHWQAAISPAMLDCPRVLASLQHTAGSWLTGCVMPA